MGFFAAYGIGILCFEGDISENITYVICAYMVNFCGPDNISLNKIIIIETIDNITRI